MENREYPWLKFWFDFFQQAPIKFLERQKTGYEYIVLYQKLLLIGRNTDGKLIEHLGEIECVYDATTIAQMTGININSVQVGLGIFEKIGLIRIDNGIIVCPAFEKKYHNLVGESVSTSRVRKFREKQKRLMSHDNSNETFHETFHETEHKSNRALDIKSSSTDNAIHILDQRVALLRDIGIDEKTLLNILSMKELPDTTIIKKYIVESKTKINPAGYVITAIKNHYPRIVQKGKKFNPNCSLCHGNGFYTIHPEGRPDVDCTIACDCYKNYKL